jgi:predicted Zn-dependent peptidase
MLWMTDLIHDASVSPDSVVNQLDLAIKELENVTQEDIDMSVVKVRSSLYDNVGGFFGVGRADLLACFALFDDDPKRINTIEEQFKKVTPEVIKKTVQEYLVPANRTILIIDPKAENL